MNFYALRYKNNSAQIQDMSKHYINKLAFYMHTKSYFFKAEIILQPVLISDSNVYTLDNAITLTICATHYFNNWCPKLSQVLLKQVI